MSVINTNVKALVAQQALKVNNRALGAAMEQLSTGRRINSAADDSAGLAIASRMTSQIRGLDQAVRNANDGISMLQTAEGSMVEVTNMLQRMRELAIQSATSTNGDTDRQYLDLEFQQLRTEIQRVTKTTTWNGMKLLDGSVNSGNQTFHVGAGTSDEERITVSIGTMSTIATGSTSAGATLTAAATASTGQINTVSISGATLGDTITLKINDTTFNYSVQSTNGTLVAADVVNTLTQSGSFAGFTFAQGTGGAEDTVTVTATTNDTPVYLSTSVSAGLSVLSTANLTDITSATNALTNVTNVDSAINAVNQKRSSLGAYINRLNYTIDNLTNISTNSAESRSRVMDADYASATSELAKTQIIQQAATAILAQANQQPQMVLSLLK